MAAGEGVVKFEAEHVCAPLAGLELAAVLEELLGWRAVLFELGLVGRDPARYDGAGFGNLSARVPPWDAGPGRRPFVVTGTQTGGKAALGPQDLCLVTAYDYARNRVQSRGLVSPSSESMTHGALYDLSGAARFVFHVHAPVLWQQAAALGLPCTRREVGYGTAEMAREVLRLVRAGPVGEVAVFAMAGHEDGVVAFGRSGRDAGGALLDQLARAHARRALCDESGGGVGHGGAGASPEVGGRG